MNYKYTRQSEVILSQLFPLVIAFFEADICFSMKLKMNKCCVGDFILPSLVTEWDFFIIVVWGNVCYLVKIYNYV